MTRKELITYCVDDQIKRGIVDPNNRAEQIRFRLIGNRFFKAMSKSECESWYREVKQNAKD